MCGEKIPSLYSVHSYVGSPPRVRGKGSYDKEHKTIKGITPACAGKRSCFQFVKGVDVDHPRVCGEKGVSERREKR